MRKMTMAAALGLALSLGAVGVASGQATQQPKREHAERGDDGDEFVNARVALLCLTVVASSCVHRPAFMQREPARRWPTAYVAAQLAADQGRYDDADHILATFAHDYPGTAEAQESGYWRAIYKLDPANKTANTRDALAGLDAYLAASRAGTNRGEATTEDLLALAREVRDGVEERFGVRLHPEPLLINCII